MNHRLATGLTATAMLGSAFAAVPAAASTPASAQAAACTSWFDEKGPGGAERFHVNCEGTGLYVRTTALCEDGSTNQSAWKYQYAKSECPYAVKVSGAWYQTCDILHGQACPTLAQKESSSSRTAAARP